MLEVLVYNKTRKEDIQVWSTGVDVCKKEEASSTVEPFCIRPRGRELSLGRGSQK